MNATQMDSILVKEYQNGNQLALEKLIERHKDDLFSFIYYKVLDEDLANDIFQDTFVRVIVILKENRYAEEGKFILWVKKIAYNLIIDYFRIKSKNKKITETSSKEEGFSVFDTLSETSLNAEEEMVKNQIFKDLHKIIHYLPESQQEVIRLRFFNEMSFKDIAEHTQTSINTILGRVRYALMNCRKIIENNQMILTKI